MADRLWPAHGTGASIDFRCPKGVDGIGDASPPQIRPVIRSPAPSQNFPSTSSPPPARTSPPAATPSHTAPHKSGAAPQTPPVPPEPPPTESASYFLLLTSYFLPLTSYFLLLTSYFKLLTSLSMPPAPRADSSSGSTASIPAADRPPSRCRASRPASAACCNASAPSSSP